jgi:RND family efflux transporter MFP subunit
MLLLSLLMACAETPPTAAQAAPTAELRTEAVVSAAWRAEEEIAGSLEPIASVQLGFSVPGRMEALLVKRGEPVKAGQALARLDSRIASAQLAQAKAALSGAEAQLAAGEAGLKRLKALHEGGGVSDQQLQDVEAGVAAGRAGVEQAEAAVRLASANYSYHTLTAPIDGVITMGPDNAGTVIGAGMPLFVIEDLSALQLKGSASESSVWLTPGLTGTVSVGFGVEAPATVVRVLPSLDMATRRLPVELRVDAPPEGMRAHAFARAQVTAGEDQLVWSVPEEAVVARPDFCVWRATEGQAERVPVTVVKREGGRALLLGALKEGDQVVLDPPADLGEG